MQKTTEQLPAELDREKEHTTKLSRQIDRLREQLRNSEKDSGIARKTLTIARGVST